MSIAAIAFQPGDPAAIRDAERDATSAHNPPRTGTLKSHLWRHRFRLAWTYALFNIENGLDLAQPWLFGLTISALLRGELLPLAAFAGFCVMRTAIGVWRHMYDTRTFMSVYGALATQLVVGQRGQKVPATKIAARVTLSREITDFLERDVPVSFATLYSVVGAVMMLAVFDPFLAPIAVALGIAGCALNLRLSRRTTELNGQLNDVYEHEVDVVAAGTPRETAEHYARIARCQVRISDWHALAFSATQGVVVTLLIIALLRVPAWDSDAIGEVFAVFRYVTMFTSGLGSVPRIVSRVARLRDIRRRSALLDSPSS